MSGLQYYITNMHEISLVENIIEIIISEMPKYNITKVDTITLRIGGMSNVMPDALSFGFDLLSKGTPLEEAKLIIENVQTRGLCKSCGHEFIMTDLLDPCPVCEGIAVEIISGKELEIVEFEGK